MAKVRQEIEVGTTSLNGVAKATASVVHCAEVVTGGWEVAPLAGFLAIPNWDCE